MICQNCGKETRGIKVNQKLYCTDCGEEINVPKDTTTQEDTALGYVNPPEPKLIDKDKIVKLQDEIKNTENLLEAEEEIIEEVSKNIPPPENIKKKTKIPKTKKKVIKTNRERTDVRHEKDFLLLKDEPDPIKDPELESPHDDQIEASKGPVLDIKCKANEINFLGVDDEQKYPLVDDNKLKNIVEKQQRHKDILTSFLKSGASQATQKKYKKADKKKHHKIFWSLSSIFFLIAIFTGLVLYVNLYGNKAAPAVEKAEATFDIAHKRPAYVPVGYELTYLTKAESDIIDYNYIYRPDKKKTLDIVISKTDLNNELIYENKVKPQGGTYYEKEANGISYWVVEDKFLYFVNNNLLYEIISSDKMPREELIKIADGLL